VGKPGGSDAVRLRFYGISLLQEQSVDGDDFKVIWNYFELPKKITSPGIISKWIF
jgi:hypothetical protein